MSGAGTQTMQNAAFCFHKGHQNRCCCNLRCGCPGVCFWIRWSRPKCHRCSLQLIRKRALKVFSCRHRHLHSLAVLPIAKIGPRHSWCFTVVSNSFAYFSRGTSCFNDRWSPLTRQQGTKQNRILLVSFLKDLLQLWKVNVAELFFGHAAPVSSHQSLIHCFSVAARKRTCWLLHSSLAGGRAGPTFSVQHLALICYQNAKRVSNRYTKNMCHSTFQACQRDIGIKLCWCQLWEPTERPFSPRAKWKNRAETWQKHPSTQGNKCFIWNVFSELTEERWAKRSFPTSSWLLEMTGYLGAVTFLRH